MMFDVWGKSFSRKWTSCELKNGLQILYFLTSALGMSHEMMVKSVVGCA